MPKMDSFRPEYIDKIALWIDEGANPQSTLDCTENEFECGDGSLQNVLWYVMVILIVLITR